MYFCDLNSISITETRVFLIDAAICCNKMPMSSLIPWSTEYKAQPAAAVILWATAHRNWQLCPEVWFAILELLLTSGVAIEESDPTSHPKHAWVILIRPQQESTCSLGLIKQVHAIHYPPPNGCNQICRIKCAFELVQKVLVAKKYLLDWRFWVNCNDKTLWT